MKRYSAQRFAIHGLLGTHIQSLKHTLSWAPTPSWGYAAVLVLFVLFPLVSSHAAVSVITKTAEVGNIREMLPFTGEIKPYQEAFLTPDINGLVDKIQVETGQAVKAGDPLVLLDKARWAIHLRVAEAQLKKAEQAVKETKSDYERNKILFDQKVLNDKAYEMAESLYVNAQNSVKEAQASVDLAKLNLARSVIVSPISGWFVNRNVFVGMGVTPGMSLGKVIDLKKVFVEARIPENQINKIKIGQDCLIDQRAGRVSHIDLYADTGRTFLVKIQITNEDLHFKANMFAKGNLILNEYKNVPLLPLEAMLTEGEKTFVFAVQGKQAHRVPIEVIALEGNMLYAKGVEAGQIIILAGQHSLKDGDEVVLPEKN